MRHTKYIPAVMLYIINRVRHFRRELGLSQRNVSRIISPNTISNLVGTIESIKGRSSYTDDQLHKIATEFTMVAIQLQKAYDEMPNGLKIKADYTLFDFYPSEPLEDKLVPKKIIVFTKELFPTGAVYTILEDTDFFDIPRTVNETTEYLNSFFEKTWLPKDIGSPLERAVAKGDLLKIEPPHSAFIMYQKNYK